MNSHSPRTPWRAIAVATLAVAGQVAAWRFPGWPGLALLLLSGIGAVWTLRWFAATLTRGEIRIRPSAGLSAAVLASGAFFGGALSLRTWGVLPAAAVQLSFGLLAWRLLRGTSFGAASDPAAPAEPGLARGVLALAGVAIAAGGVLFLAGVPVTGPWAGRAALGWGMLLGGAALCLPLSGSLAESVRETGSFRRLEAALLAAILVVAALAMLRDLGTVPGGLEANEVEYVKEAHRIANGSFRSPYMTGGYSHQSILVWWFGAPLVRWFGSGEIPLRIPSVFFALATVFVAHFLIRRMWGWRAGLIAALILAGSAKLLYQGRIIAVIVYHLFFFGLCFYFLTAAARTGSARLWMFAGSALSLGCYGYWPVQAIVPATAAALAIAAIANRSTAILRGAGMLFAGFALLAVPLYLSHSGRFGGHYFQAEQYVPWGEMKAAPAEFFSKLLHGAMYASLLYPAGAPDRYWIANGPPFDRLSSALWAVGLFVSVRFALRLPHTLWLLCLAAGLAAFALPAPWQLGMERRAALALLPSLLFVSQGAVVVGVALRTFGTFGRRVWFPVTLAGAAAIGVYNEQYVFRPHVEDPTTFDFHKKRLCVVAADVAPEVAKRDVVFSLEHNYEAFEIYAFGSTVQREPFRPSDSLFRLPVREAGRVFVLSYPYADSAGLVRELYPAARERKYRSAAGAVDTVVFDVDRREIEATLGLVESPPGRWAGALLVETPGTYELERKVSFGMLRVDGTDLPARTKRFLGRGLHPFECAGAQPWGGVALLRSDNRSVRDLERKDFRTIRDVRGVAVRYRSLATGAEPLETGEVLALPVVENWILPKPATADWDFWLIVPVGQPRRLGIESDVGGTIEADGAHLATFQAGTGYVGFSTPLAAGRHRVHIHMENRSTDLHRTVLFWIPDGGERVVVPRSATEPAWGRD